MLTCRLLAPPLAAVMLNLSQAKLVISIGAALTHRQLRPQTVLVDVSTVWPRPFVTYVTLYVPQLAVLVIVSRKMTLPGLYWGVSDVESSMTFFLSYGSSV